MAIFSRDTLSYQMRQVTHRTYQAQLSAGCAQVGAEQQVWHGKRDGATSCWRADLAQEADALAVLAPLRRKARDGGQLADHGLGQRPQWE